MSTLQTEDHIPSQGQTHSESLRLQDHISIVTKFEVLLYSFGRKETVLSGAAGQPAVERSIHVREERKHCPNIIISKSVCVQCSKRSFLVRNYLLFLVVGRELKKKKKKKRTIIHFIKVLFFVLPFISTD